MSPREHLACARTHFKLGLIDVALAALAAFRQWIELPEVRP